VALKFERRHLTFRTWYHKRNWGGLGEIVPDDGCCILLETGAPDHILLEDESGCIEPEDCPDVASDFLFLSDPADNFEFLDGAGSNFEFLE